MDTCQAAVVYNGPDTNSGSVTRTCTDKAGNTGSDTASFKYDATAPTVSVTPDRPGLIRVAITTLGDFHA